MQVKEKIENHLSIYGVEFKINSVEENLDNFYEDGIDYIVDVVFKFNTKKDYGVIWDNFIYPNISFEEGHYLFELLYFTNQRVGMILPLRIGEENV